MSAFTLDDLERIIAERAKADPADSWTARLLVGGPGKSARKMGEEAIETIIAAVAEDRDALVRESADLVYHWMVVLASAGIELSDVLAELERRTQQSGLAEKASRTSDR